MSKGVKKFKPSKILGKGSEGVVILTNNKDITIKIYRVNARKMISLLRIVKYIKKYDLPTLYKSYEFLDKKNSLDRYKNKLPEYFSYIDEKNLEKLSKNFIMKSRLIEIMKTYQITLNDFLKIKNIPNKVEILKSLFYQGILTLTWLYYKKGILHKDISLDNFFVEKTNIKKFEIKIGRNIYEIDLEGYYLVFNDFGHSRSLELFDVDEYPDSLNSTFGSGSMNPYYELLDFINIFKKYIKLNINHSILSTGMYNSGFNTDITSEYKKLIKSYVKYDNFKQKLKIFKKKYLDFVINKILNMID